MSTSPADFNAQIIEEFHANQGRVGGMFEGMPLLLLHHTGAKSGKRRIKPFRNVDRPRTRFLSVEEAKRMLNALPRDFRQLARGSPYSGLRLGELLALRVMDFADG